MPNATLPEVAKRVFGDRRIEFFFDLGPSSPDQTPGTQYATVSVGHSKDRKQFYAVLNQKVEEDKTGPFSVMRYHPFDQISLAASQRVARFSQAKLEEFATKVLAALPEMAAEKPQIAARLTQPDHDV